MNISNEVLFKAVTAFVDTIADVIAEEVAAKTNIRIEMLEMKFQNTLDNMKPILENMNERHNHLADDLQKLTDRFDHLSTASDERIVEIIKEVVPEFMGEEQVERICDVQIENALEQYDPSDALDEGDLAQTVLDSYTFQDGLKDAIKELNFTVEVH